ncbi:MAG: transposase [Bacteroidota bacterium]
MAGTFTQLYVHAVTAVKFRQSLIDPSWEDSLFTVMGGTLKELGHTPIIINGTDDHLHLLWGHKQTAPVDNTLKMVKGRSSKWINDHGLVDGLFRWQPGYGAFSVSVDRVPRVKGYIAKQKEHHQVIDFQTEYEKLLIDHGVSNLDYLLFDPPV